MSDDAKSCGNCVRAATFAVGQFPTTGFVIDTIDLPIVFEEDENN